VALAAVGFVAVAMFALFLSGLAPSGMDNPWYAAANRPPITPPGFVFPLVWVPLYFLMGVSAFLVWGEVKGQTLQAFPAFTLWGVQLLLSVAWSWAFFGLRSPWLGLVVIVALWVAIAAMIAAFWRVHAGAGAMNLPYLAWVSFATVLNLWFALIN
jgi:tryptophan-rich sensory protein